ncbi:MAG: TonB-dependent receptor [Acidobacteriia bacterium]|nr:TonB-dependent receptor [Terriglobia bacterium]
MAPNSWSVSKVTLIAAVIALSVRSAAAESGGIEVRVFDASGRSPVAGVSVGLSNALGLVAAATVPTGADGVAFFPVLRPGGGYVVEVSTPGFARVRILDVRVRIEEVTRIPIRLVPEIRESVKVVERRAGVDLDRTSKTTTFDDTFIQDLPSQGRFYQGLLSLAPGVVDPKGDGNPNVHGARAVDFQTQVGGVSNQDPLTGGWMSYLNPDAIEELEVIGAGAGVEFGRAQGGFAQVIQKQGSNEFEGLTNLLWQSSLMDGRAAAGTPGTRVPRYDWIQPAVQLSGAIVRDRLWYRLSHEFISRQEPVTALDGTILATRRQGIHADQITWQASPRNKLALEIREDPLTLTYVGASALSASDTTMRYESGGPTFALTWTAPVSPAILVDTVASYQRGHQNLLPMVSGARNTCTEGFVNRFTGEPLLPALDTVQCTNTDTGVTTGSYSSTWRDERQRLTLKSQASIFGGRLFGMTHQLKVGANIENERYFRRLERRPDMTLTIKEVPIVGSDGRTHRALFASLALEVASPPSTRSTATDVSYGFFLEDQAKPLPNLSVTAGLRVDREEMRGSGFRPFDPAAESRDFLGRMSAGSADGGYSEAASSFTGYGGLEDLVRGMADATQISESFLWSRISPGLIVSQSWAKQRAPADIDIANTNLSPRLSVAWDPGGKGKSKIAVTAGRYYGTLLLAVPLVEEEPVTTTMGLQATRVPPSEIWTDLHFSTGIDPAVSARVIDHRLKTPYQDELTVSLEREIARETTARVAFISRRFWDQLQDVDLNHHAGDFGHCVYSSGEDQPWIVAPPDGVPDDCDGIIVLSSSRFFGQVVQRHQSDGYLDSYVYNPGWGAIYQVGNDNTARYKGIVLEVTRRQYRNWQMQASYTWSRAVGDAEEFNSYLGDDPANREAERGYLSYDQRHVVKVNATTITPWGFRFGASANWMSGLPYSILQVGPSLDSVPSVYPSIIGGGMRNRTRYATGRRNDQRNRPSLTLNVKLDKEFNLSRGQNLQISLDVFNLLDDRNYRIYNPQLGYGRQLNERNDATVTPGRQYQVGLRLAF